MILASYFPALFEWEFMERNIHVEVRKPGKKTHKAKKAVCHSMWHLKNNGQGAQIIHATDHH